MKRIIFLDVDGVLNSEETVDYYGHYGGWFGENDEIDEVKVAWGQQLVDNLKYIVEQTNAEIVVSSTWRVHFSLQKFSDMFKIYGWENVPLIGKTESLAASRGVEINQWLNANEGEIESYVILDDNDWFLTEQQSSFIKTSIFHGLSFKDAAKAVEILLKNSPEKSILLS